MARYTEVVNGATFESTVYHQENETYANEAAVIAANGYTDIDNIREKVVEQKGTPVSHTESDPTATDAKFF